MHDSSLFFSLRGGIDVQVLEGDRDALPRQHFCSCQQRHLSCQILEAFLLSSVGVVMLVGVLSSVVIFEMAGKVRVESSQVALDVTFVRRRRTNHVFPQTNSRYLP